MHETEDRTAPSDGLSMIMIWKPCSWMLLWGCCHKYLHTTRFCINAGHEAFALPLNLIPYPLLILLLWGSNARYGKGLYIQQHWLAFQTMHKVKLKPRWTAAAQTDHNTTACNCAKGGQPCIMSGWSHGGLLQHKQIVVWQLATVPRVVYRLIAQDRHLSTLGAKPST